MKAVIVGGVAGGASAAARIRRLDEHAQIIMIERSGYVSYANCGLPYYVGGVIKEQEELTLQTPESFWDRFRIDVRVRQEVTAINPAEKTVTVRALDSGKTYTETYDKLLLAPGAKPTVPALSGVDSERVFTLRTVEDTLSIRRFVEEQKPKTAVLAGGGFIGLEMAENLVEMGVSVTIVQRPKQLLAPLDNQFLHAVAGVCQPCSGLHIVLRHSVKGQHGIRNFLCAVLILRGVVRAIRASDPLFLCAKDSHNLAVNLGNFAGSFHAHHALAVLRSPEVVIERDIWNNPQFFTEKGQVAFGQIFPGANKNDFPQPKSVEYVMEAIRTITHDDDIVLDSFAGSGTTGQAVLNLNSDGGHRKFILVEMMDYADSITAERVKRVIKGYGEGKNAVEGTGGNFSFYDLGEPLLVGDCLNEAVAPEKIREYIWFMETKQPYAPPSGGNPYYLGKHNSTGYYFYYEPQRVTVLDYAFLSTITEKADGTVIYADRCSISEDKLAKMGVTFKKIPRDISRL